MNASIKTSTRLRSFRAQSALQHGVLVTLLAVALPTLFGFMLSAQQHCGEALALNLVAQNVARTLASGLPGCWKAPRWPSARGFGAG